MGKDKLRKWKENATFSHVFEPDLKDIVDGATLNRGQWAETVFGNDRPITLELGCGKGEYTVGLGPPSSRAQFHRRRHQGPPVLARGQDVLARRDSTTWPFSDQD